MSLWEYVGAWSAVTKRLRRFNWDTTDSSGNWWNGTSITWFWYADWKYWQCLDRTWSWATDRVEFADWSHDGFDSWYMYSVRFNTDTAPGTTQTIIATDYFSISVRSWPVVDIRDYSWSVEPIITFAISTNTRYRVVATYNGSTLVLYVDWESRWSSSLPSVAHVSRWFNVWNYWVAGAFNTPFSWFIDEIVVENRYWFAKEEKKQYTWARGMYSIL